MNCVLFGKYGEMVAQKFSKGKPMLVEGRMKTESWETDGGKRSAQKCMVEKVHFTESKNEAHEATQETTPSSESGEDIPF